MRPACFFPGSLPAYAGLIDAVLIAAAHGTASPAGLATLRSILAAVRAARPGLAVVESYLDVASPTFTEIVAAVDGPAVVVPVLLSGGYHVRTDIPAVVADHPEIAVSPALGPDPALAVALADRLGQAGFNRAATDAVVLVAAGSSDPLARADVERAAAALAALLAVGVGVEAEVIVAVMSGPGRRLADVRAERPEARLAVATYLLAEGFFQAQMGEQAAALDIGVVSAPLGAHPAVIGLVLNRFDAVLQGRAAGVL